MIQILIVEDEPNIAELIQIALQKAEYGWDYAPDGKVAADKLEETDYDLVLLDIMLPEFDGYELMEYIEPLGIPVIFITAKGSLKDKIRGLTMGADDYIVKPFEMDELLARIASVLRRYHKNQSSLQVLDIQIDLKAHRIVQNGTVISLTPKEYELLLFLIQNKNVALYRDSLFERVWQEELPESSRTLDLHIQRLRKKLDWYDKIKTIHRIGYMLET
ncbi:response regulator transcription factor [Anaerolentibacter hominis]|uniref:response regulator transcription factor n=1 Tax=Anaerolentibacter hominis TaxID=3079009 RepID=UPI0031B861C5